MDLPKNINIEVGIRLLFDLITTLVELGPFTVALIFKDHTSDLRLGSINSTVNL